MHGNERKRERGKLAGGEGGEETEEIEEDDGRNGRKGEKEGRGVQRRVAAGREEKKA